MTDPILQNFFEYTVGLKQDQIDFLVVKNSVPVMALCWDSDRHGCIVGAADIVFEGAHTFTFAQEDEREPIVPALVFVARDRAGDPFDLIGWAPRSARVAAFYGRAPLLGEQTLYQSRLSGPPQIHRDVASWLRSGRDGVVIVNPIKAARAILDSPGRLAVEDRAHAAEIARLLTSTIDLGRIVVPVRSAA